MGDDNVKDFPSNPDALMRQGLKLLTEHVNGQAERSLREASEKKDAEERQLWDDVFRTCMSYGCPAGSDPIEVATKRANAALEARRASFPAKT